tara:strand:+ start:468 stop:839 length:372 start_codon:yes stop_codon:yes gene_type:complete
MTLTVNNKTQYLEAGIDTMLNFARGDYANWTSRNGTKKLNDINEKMIKEFNTGFVVKYGSKYAKILNRHQCWGFVVATDTDKKFKKGDILMAAGYNKPARNAARGNVLDGGYQIAWTGPLYLK